MTYCSKQVSHYTVSSIPAILWLYLDFLLIVGKQFKKCKQIMKMLNAFDLSLNVKTLKLMFKGNFFEGHTQVLITVLNSVQSFP